MTLSTIYSNVGQGRNDLKQKNDSIFSNFLKNRGGTSRSPRILRIKKNNKKHKEKNKE